MSRVVDGQEWRGKIGRLSPEEMNEFLAGNTIAKLGCLDDEGWPYVVPVWYEYADGGFYIIPRERSDWARFIKADGRVFLCIDRSDTQNRRVLVKGRGRIVEEPNLGGKWVDIARRMSVRYLGEHGPEYLEPTMVEPRWLIFVEPVKLTTWNGVGWAQRYKHGSW